MIAREFPDVPGAAVPGISRHRDLGMQGADDHADARQRHAAGLEPRPDFRDQVRDRIDEASELFRLFEHRAVVFRMRQVRRADAAHVISGNESFAIHRAVLP